MAEITKELGRVPISRGEFNLATTYYKDNIVQYKYASYQVTTESITGVAPVSPEGVVNTGWIIFGGGVETDKINKVLDHGVLTDNWDAQDDNPELPQEKEFAEESSYAYNWKTTDTPASDGKREGNLKDFYNKVLNVEEKDVEQDAKLSELEGEVDAIGSKFNGIESKDIDINSLTVISRRPTWNVWAQASSSSHSVIEVRSGSIVTISCGSNIGYYCFLTDYIPTDPENAIPPKYAEGYSDLMGIAANDTKTINAPSDAKYLLILRTIFSGECSPNSVMVENPGRKLDVEFDTIVGGKGLYIKNGKYIGFETGEELEQAEFSATDFLLLTKDVDIIVSGVNSGAAAILAFYDKDKNFINVAYNFLREKRVSVADIPANAMYIRSSSRTSGLSEKTRIQVASLGGLSSLVSNDSDNDTEHDDNLLIDINATPIKELDRYPRITTHTISGSEFSRTKIYDVRNAKKVTISYQDVDAEFGIAFSTNCDDRAGFNANTRVEWWTAYPSRTGSVSVNVPAGALYLAVEKNTTKDVVVTTYGELKEYTRNPYFGKTCIYMGDSISTSDGFYWKGYLESFFGIKYTRNKQGELWPALGGMTLMPPTADEESFWTSRGKDIKDHASIWYRCANHRMRDLGYVFDMISIFGGTNDMASEALKVGDIDAEGNWVNVSTIIPYVDDASTFANPSKYTNTFSGNITFAQCLMGCIEMMHRDFPTMKIIIPTVMPCGGNYGNYIFSKEDSPANGLSLSERLAMLAIKIVERYIKEGLDIVSVPLYWDNRNVKNVSAFSYLDGDDNDGVHPNHTQAKRMVSLVKDALMF